MNDSENTLQIGSPFYQGGVKIGIIVDVDITMSKDGPTSTSLEIRMDNHHTARVVTGEPKVVDNMETLKTKAREYVKRFGKSNHASQ